MKTYKLVHLNKSFKLSREKDLEQAEAVINQYVSEGWTLQQIVPTATGVGVLAGLFYKEEP